MNKKDINGKLHGYWEVRHFGGIIYSKGNFFNDKRIGLWKCYNIYGTLTSKEYFI